MMNEVICVHTACLFYCHICCAKSFTMTAIDHRQVRISPSIPTISAAVTACEGMSQWEMALRLFFKSPCLSSKQQSNHPYRLIRHTASQLEGQVLVLFCLTGRIRRRSGWSGRDLDELGHFCRRKGWPLGRGRWLSWWVLEFEAWETTWNDGAMICLEGRDGSGTVLSVCAHEALQLLGEFEERQLKKTAPWQRIARSHLLFGRRTQSSDVPEQALLVGSFLSISHMSLSAEAAKEITYTAAISACVSWPHFQFTRRVELICLGVATKSKANEV